MNARDQIIRLQQTKSKNPVTKIDIEYDKDTKMWSIYNDGEGIDCFGAHKSIIHW